MVAMVAMGWSAPLCSMVTYGYMTMATLYELKTLLLRQQGSYASCNIDNLGSVP